MKLANGVVALVLAAGWTLLHGRAAASGPGDAMQQLVGTWIPISVEDTMANGETHSPSYGNHPRGYLIYDAGGHMAVQLMNPDREKVSLRTASPEQFKAAARGFLAYSGTYTVNRSDGTIVHHVECALDPADVGTDRVRHFVLAGDKITLTLSPYNDYGTIVQKRVLVWKRLR
jgi:hypothetical protein